MTTAELDIVARAVDHATEAMKRIEASLSNVGKAAGKLKDDSDKASHGFGGLIDTLGKVGFGVFGITQIGGALSGLTEGLLGDAIEAEKVAAATEAVLASTKGVAGMSKEAINDLASSLSMLTPFEDEAIQSGENLLLTFTNIGSDVFPEATEAMLNMSQALGQDLKSSAIQLGKALNDPVEGATALRRVGVSLTESQMDLIKELVKSGDLLGAQKVILGELQTEFGGAARAAGETFAGRMKILQTQIGNVKEAIGGAFLPVLSKLMEKVTPLVQAFGQWLPGAIDSTMNVLKPLGSFVVNVLVSGFETVASVLRPLIGVFQGVEGAGLALHLTLERLVGLPLANVFIEAIHIFERLGEIVRKVIAGDIGGAFDSLLELINQDYPRYLAALLSLGRALFEWIAPMIPPMLAEMGKLAGQLLTWIEEQAGPILKRLGEWAASFIAWIAPLIPQFLQQWPAMLNQFLDWIGEAAGPILKQLGEWAFAFIKWVIPMIPPFLVALAGILAALIIFILETAAVLGLKLAEWGWEFVKWVAPKIPELLWELGLMLGKVLWWLVSEALPAIALKLAEWGLAFVEWVGDAASKLPGALWGMMGDLGSWIVSEGAPWLAGKAGELGGALLKGLGDGLGDLGSWLWQKLTDMINGIQINIGPFHLSPAGWRIDVPTLPTLPTLPGMPAPVAVPAPTDNTFMGVPMPSMDRIRDLIGQNIGLWQEWLAAGGSGDYVEFWKHGKRIGVPGFARGGVSAGGLAVVGEAGPELVNLPRGAQVIPLSSSSRPASTMLNVYVIGNTMLGDDRSVARYIARILKPELDAIVSISA